MTLPTTTILDQIDDVLDLFDMDKLTYDERVKLKEEIEEFEDDTTNNGNS